MKQSLLGAALLTVMGGALALPAAAAVVDPFYSTREQEGITALERGSFRDAAASLRIACFGMLDEPARLSPCLVRLALAQAGANDRDGFAQTFNRLLEGEQLLGLYSKYPPPRDLVVRFEAKAAEWIPRATLEAAPTFARLATDAREQQLGTLQPAARRDRLDQLEKQEPKESHWPLLRARFERDQGDAHAALAAAERALKLAPTDRDAHCVHGWALGQLGRAGEAAADVAACPGAVVAIRPAERAPTPGSAKSGEGSSAPAATPAPPSQRRIAATAPNAPTAPTGAAPTGASTAVAAGDATTLPPADAALLARAQSQLAAARTAADIDSAYAIASDLAKRYPHQAAVQHTAAEIAYRASRWSEAVRHFRQGGDPGEDRPLLLFYYAVSLWESGSRQEAAATMRRVDGKLRPTPFVEAYRAKILGRG